MSLALSRVPVFVVVVVNPISSMLQKHTSYPRLPPAASSYYCIALFINHMNLLRFQSLKDKSQNLIKCTIVSLIFSITYVVLNLDFFIDFLIQKIKGKSRNLVLYFSEHPQV